MNDRQRAFAEFFAACGNAAEAARRAGYSTQGARQQGERLLSNVDIQKYLSEITGQLAEERIADAAEVKRYLTDTMRSSSEKTSDRIKAGVQLLRAAGPLPAPCPEDSPEEECSILTDDSTKETRIALPYNGDDPTTINAFMLSGEVVPFAGHETDDVLIYATLNGWREEDQLCV